MRNITIERMVRALAGGGVLLSLALGVLHSPYWLWLTAFAGVNLLQSAFTQWCPAITVLEKMGFRRCE